MFTGLAPVLRHILLLNLAILGLMTLILTMQFGSLFSGSASSDLRNDPKALEELARELGKNMGHLSLEDHSAAHHQAPGHKVASAENNADSTAQTPVEVDHSKMNLFIGVLTRPGDRHRRDFHRNVCAAQYKKYSADNLFSVHLQIKYKFFVGRPSVNHFEQQDHNEEGRLANAEEQRISSELEQEEQQFGDIAMLDYVDNAEAENKISKTESVFEYGLDLGQEDRFASEYDDKSQIKKSEWKPTHIAKVDGDYCLDADALEKMLTAYNSKLQNDADQATPLQEKETTEHGSTEAQEWENKDHVRFTQTEQIPLSSGSASLKMFTGVSQPIADLLWDSNGKFKGGRPSFMRSSEAQHADHTLEHINSKYHPRLQLIGASLWSQPHYKSQLGVDTGFAPYPSHYLEIMSKDLAKAIFYTDRFHTKNWQRYGNGSEDVMVGRWAAFAIAKHDLVVDYLELQSLKSDKEYQIPQFQDDLNEQAARQRYEAEKQKRQQNQQQHYEQQQTQQQHGQQQMNGNQQQQYGDQYQQQQYGQGKGAPGSTEEGQGRGVGHPADMAMHAESM